MTDKELLQQALEALETVFMPHHPAVIALRERLAEPMYMDLQHATEWASSPAGQIVLDELEKRFAPLVVHQTARQWQGLTEEEVALLEWAVCTLGDFSASDRSRPAWQFVYMPKLTDLRNMVEQHSAKLREKNA